MTPSVSPSVLSPWEAGLKRITRVTLLIFERRYHPIFAVEVLRLIILPDVVIFLSPALYSLASHRVSSFEVLSCEMGSLVRL